MPRRLLIVAGLFACGTPLVAQPPAADNGDAIVCQLLENCATPPQSEPRTSNARGFSFTRPGEKASTPQSSVKSAVRRRKAQPRPVVAPPRVPGTYDLRVTFVLGSDMVNADSRERIRTFATALNDPRLAGRRVLIEGHTDSTGDPVRNQDLSERRARAVAEIVSGNDVDPQRLDVAGYGSTRPLPGLSGSNGANRRVVASLVK